MIFLSPPLWPTVKCHQYIQSCASRISHRDAAEYFRRVCTFLSPLWKIWVDKSNAPEEFVSSWSTEWHLMSRAVRVCISQTRARVFPIHPNDTCRIDFWEMAEKEKKKKKEGEFLDLMCSQKVASGLPSAPSEDVNKIRMKVSDRLDPLHPFHFSSALISTSSPPPLAADETCECVWQGWRNI